MVSHIFSGRVKLKRFKQQPNDLKHPGWHSWDPHPWQHPWLITENLERVKIFSKEILEKEKRALDRRDPKKLEIAFTGNIANCMYVRAVPLRRAGMNVLIYPHPWDDYIMSHPCWEEYDGTIPADIDSYSKLKKHGIRLPRVREVIYTQAKPELVQKRSNAVTKILATILRFPRLGYLLKYPGYLQFLDTLAALQSADAIWSTQQVYMGYLANRPYVVSQSGGDIWFEASRDDQLGEITRRSFANSRLFLVSNPWSFAHARRFGFTNLVYLPKIIDETVYAPGYGHARKEWEARSGGRFFVLSSSRLDERNKGSSIGIRGFAEFSRSHEDARLVLIGWGKHKDNKRSLLQELGIEEKVIFLPVSGKARVRDYLRSADVFIDQFVLGYYGSAGMEAMACGLPVIGRIESAQYDAMCETGAPPILNAKNQEQVADHLAILKTQDSYRKELAGAHRGWFLANHSSERWLEEHQAVLAATAKNRPLDLSGSPLHEPLSDVERSYHEEGLSAAPPFPNYGW